MNFTKRIPSCKQTYPPISFHPLGFNTNSGSVVKFSIYINFHFLSQEVKLCCVNISNCIHSTGFQDGNYQKKKREEIQTPQNQCQENISFSHILPKFEEISSNCARMQDRPVQCALCFNIQFFQQFSEKLTELRFLGSYQ